MRLTIVGCSGSYPGPESAASSYLLEEEHEGRTWRILLDLGNGALGQLHRYADPLDIDAVLLSHLHADHCLDLCGYYVMRKYHPTGAQPRIPVWGPAGTAERMARAYDLPLDPGMTEEFDFLDYGSLGPSVAVEVGPFRVEPREVVHPVPAYALRVTAGGRTLVYSGDTGPCPALDEAATGADLLLAEASFRDADDNPPELHLTGSDCGRAATKASVGRLVLTHIPPWHDEADARAEARTEWAGQLDLARAGATYEI
ncbi:MBL fold metallo-hydrolase [Nocardioides hwasunensis]|uniref:MBL fold metallo-hydrolase n=1 Tax=Nocardioides hwasunensis TaxID=397258 RepID=A0ABR8MEX8_9ACTN|nr:MBL fold metallo-hydrolase [Nocardioides hwasunensis]MBD3913034.1 MBL fold metallo-hydrolase [Nocardioides hwasunensis]